MSFERTVAVLGASYGGTRAAQVLADGLPENWRVVLIDRNSHMNHLYVFPRVAILPEHAHKAFIPYTNVFKDSAKRHLVLHAQVTSITEHWLTLSKSFPELNIVGEPAPILHFDYLIYALGSHLPSPIDVWRPLTDPEKLPVPDTILVQPHDGSKAKGLEWLKGFTEKVERAESILIVGGGALGIQYASDIADVFPHKKVTLLHSRDKLLPRFDESMHDEIFSTLEDMRVNVMLNERLDISTSSQTVINNRGVPEHVVRTQSGREIRAECLLLCTGQAPNTSMMKEFIPTSIISDGPSRGMIRVNRSLQIATLSDVHAVAVKSTTFQKSNPNPGLYQENDDTGMQVPYPHLFAIGDAADAFGAMKAGHTAYYQGEVAARNTLTLIANASLEKNVALENYSPGAPAIKVSLGLSKAVYQVQDQVGTKTDVSDDLDAPLMWKLYGFDPDQVDMHL